MSDVTTTAPKDTPPKFGGRIVALLLLSLPIALYGLSFPWTNVNPPFKERLLTLPWAALPHFLGGGIALLIGGLQFSARLRATRPKLHRLIGRVYLLAVLAGGLGGLSIATISHGGASTHIGFGMLALLWLGSGMAAWQAILRGDVRAHRRWMMRNFALTFAAVMLRIDIPILQAVFGVPFDEAYQTVAWLCWVPNLLIVEWWLLRDGAELHAQPSTNT